MQPSRRAAISMLSKQESGGTMTRRLAMPPAPRPSALPFHLVPVNLIRPAAKRTAHSGVFMLVEFTSDTARPRMVRPMHFGSRLAHMVTAPEEPEMWVTG
ncbi:hypothetical protein HMPREF9946_03410 [Acetobacteraceae bacterium AT-5844]|nr:hypothetical protein HMPREF9946_03410 [Acetobacteraceae bacterium AT-5844]